MVYCGEEIKRILSAGDFSFSLFQRQLSSPLEIKFPFFFSFHLSAGFIVIQSAFKEGKKREKKKKVLSFLSRQKASFAWINCA